MSVVATGMIGTGQSEHLDVVLEGGHTYFTNVYPSEAGVDFDLHIYDQNGNLVSWDETRRRTRTAQSRRLSRGRFGS
jgi:hypothetical protein